ncbi:unnamed protein product [Brassica oleracea var. botrytis]
MSFIIVGPRFLLREFESSGSGTVDCPISPLGSLSARYVSGSITCCSSSCGSVTCCSPSSGTVTCCSPVSKVHTNSTSSSACFSFFFGFPPLLFFFPPAITIYLEQIMKGRISSKLTDTDKSKQTDQDQPNKQTTNIPNKHRMTMTKPNKQTMKIINRDTFHTYMASQSVLTFSASSMSTSMSIFDGNGPMSAVPS